MASINKSFNFRHGVQVDDDDFTVRGGLVGIGTTVPTERLDVRGNAVVSGLTSSISLQVTGVTTLTTVDIGITSIKSGIITASSGIVTYYGDGQYLKFLPTSQWVDIDVGLGFTSIYNTGGNVGVSTNDPRNSFQVGGDPTNSSTGVGINSDGGHIFASGIVTATSFVGEVNAPNFDTNAAGVVVSGIVTATSLEGALTGNVTGNVTGDLTGEVNSSKFDTNPSGIVVTGVATATSFVGDITGNVTGNISGNVTASTLNVSGVSTFSEDIITGVGATVGIGTTVFFGSGVRLLFGNDDYRISHDGFNSYLDSRKGDLNIRTLDSASGFGGSGTNVQIIFNNEYMARFIRNSSVDLYYDNGLKFKTSGIGVTVYNQLDTTNLSVSGVSTFTGATTHSGGATVNTHLNVIGLTTLDDVNVSSGATFGGAVNVTGNMQSANLGLGIAPTTDLQIYNASGESAIVLGRGTAITGNNASIRSNTTNASFPYSANQESLDIINYGKGNFNYYLESGTVGLNTGGFHWHRRSSFSTLMSLTYGGDLGIGVTVPTNKLHVVGTSTVTGAAYFGTNVSIGNNLVVANTVTASNLSVPTITTNLVGNVNAASGISTFTGLKVNGAVEFNQDPDIGGVGIGTTASGHAFAVGTSPVGRLVISGGGEIGIKTTSILPATQLDCSQGQALFGQIGVGITISRSAADFGNAGVTTTRHMIMPRVTTSERNLLNGVINGSIVYNTSTNKFQGRANGAWVDLH